MSVIERRKIAKRFVKQTNCRYVVNGKIYPAIGRVRLLYYLIPDSHFCVAIVGHFRTNSGKKRGVSLLSTSGAWYDRGALRVTEALH